MWACVLRAFKRRGPLCYCANVRTNARVAMRGGAFKRGHGVGAQLPGGFPQRGPCSAPVPVGPQGTGTLGPNFHEKERGHPTYPWLHSLVSPPRQEPSPPVNATVPRSIVRRHTGLLPVPRDAQDRALLYLRHARTLRLRGSDGPRSGLVSPFGLGPSLKRTTVGGTPRGGRAFKRCGFGATT